jgi:hypothetical protein
MRRHRPHLKVRPTEPAHDLSIRHAPGLPLLGAVSTLQATIECGVTFVHYWYFAANSGHNSNQVWHPTSLSFLFRLNRDRSIFGDKSRPLSTSSPRPLSSCFRSTSLGVYECHCRRKFGSSWPFGFESRELLIPKLISSSKHRLTHKISGHSPSS